MQSKLTLIKALRCAGRIITDNRNVLRYRAGLAVNVNGNIELFSYFDTTEGLNTLHKALEKMLHPMTLEEAEYIDPNYKAEGGIPVYVERLEGGSKWALPVLLDFRRNEYGQTWRCWRMKPTPEESAAVPWEDRTYED